MAAGLIIGQAFLVPDPGIAPHPDLAAGTVIDFPGGLFLVTADGLMICRDNITRPNVECSATGPVVPA